MEAPSDGKRPATPSAPPDLHACIQSITSLGSTVPLSALSGRDSACLATAMVGYCIHLSRDQDAIHSRKDVASGLPPAMRELVTDPSLLKCILSMLSHDPDIGGTSGPQNAKHMPAPGDSCQQKHERKRSPSEDMTPNTIRKKPTSSACVSSPVPMNRSHPKPFKTSVVVSGEGSKGHPPVKNIPILAVNILYVVFQHADQWPVQIMKAFAEDSFGSRSWTDDARCKAFVSNLEISLKTKEIDDNLDQKSASVANDVETYLSSLIALSPLTKPTAPPSNKVTNRAKLSSKEKRKQTSITPSCNTTSSSSSGEEEVLESETVISSLSLPSHPLDSIFFQPSSNPNKTIRPRYHRSSLDLIYEAISGAFQDRLDSKSKQNYRLLQILPPFLSIPRVRCLATRHLERWLQSPALAGLARNIFACAVQELSCVEPPLPDDLELIENILKLNLKANQRSMHIEHITMAISCYRTRSGPSLDVAKLIFAHCIQGECSSGIVSNAFKPNDDHLRMLRSVYAVLDRKLAATALASCVSSNELNPEDISCLLSSVVDALGKLYDGFHFVKAIIRAQSGGTSKTMTSVNATARLIFECTLLVTRTIPYKTSSANNKIAVCDFEVLDQGELNCFRKDMLALRKTALRWVLTDLCPVYHNKVVAEENRLNSDTYYEQGAVTKGPGAPDFNCVLGVNPEANDLSSPFHKMMTLIRCILFLSPKELETFAMTGDESDKDRFQRIMFCCQYGADADDEMLQIILSSPHVTPNTALSVIESFLLRCRNAKISCTVDTVWDMYKLAEYKPVFRSDFSNNGRSFSPSGDDLSTSDGIDSETEQSGRKRKHRTGDQAFSKPNKTSKLPRLAVTSMWWRISSIALVLSGMLPDQIGAKMWDEHPTVRALIRMTTSQKYRFPTADCNESEKERVRRAEETVKEEEAHIAERLFLPTKEQKNTKPLSKMVAPVHRGRGIRTSARQRQKKEKHMAIERERQAATFHAENTKVRKILRILQKNVMLYDPKQVQRKPPKGSIDLLLSVGGSFDLAEKFRLSTSPDFLLTTIGEGRSAIERAYDWLIPIISSHPAIIHRLQPSASCFLLLRAYGVDGDKNRELLGLTAPLLSHVTKSLTGEFGKHHALLALELLLQDIADENNDRRRCARKVLQEAIGLPSDKNRLQVVVLDRGHCGWLLQITHVRSCNELVPLVIKYLTRALAYECGKVLETYIAALREYKVFFKSSTMTPKVTTIEEDFDFVSTLSELITVRSRVFSDTCDQFPSLRALAIAEVKNAFEQAIESNGNNTLQMASASSLVVMAISREVSDPVQKENISHVVVSSNLLHAAIILISNWQEKDSCENEAHHVVDQETSILYLLRYLVMPNGLDEGDGNTVSGLSGAKLKHNEKRAVSVEEWVLLAKARSEQVAKHAALSAPNIFLPRLLLCCGMPRLSFYTMLSRLDRMGDSSDDSGKLYIEMISPTAVSEWGLPGIGSRRVIKQKLYGRILAYLRIYGKHAADGDTQDLNIKSSFVSWLSAEKSCSDSATMVHSKDPTMTDMERDSEDSFDDLMEGNIVAEEGTEEPGDIWSRHDLNNVTSLTLNETISEDFVNACIHSNQCNVLEQSLDLVTTKSLYSKEFKQIAAFALLESNKSGPHNFNFVRLLLAWVPMLTRDRGEDHLWRLIFIEQTTEIQDWYQLKALVCDCALRWSYEHIDACQEWIFSQQTSESQWSVCSLELALRFLVVSSEQKSIHCFDYDDYAHSHSPYVQSEEDAISVTKLALNYVNLEYSGEITDVSQEAGKAAADRNSFPDWLTLVLLVGKSHQSVITRLVLEKIDGTRYALMLSSVLLRLYLMFPLKMNINDSKLRNALLQAANDCLPSWLFWRCQIDSQLSEMLSNLTTSPHQCLVQSVTEIAKQHPLIFVRHLHAIGQRLLEDGSGRDNDQHRLMKRGRVFGKNSAGDAVAKIGDRTAKVTVVLWGHSFNDPIWTSVIDVLMALPLEVIFTCGAKVGLGGILESYLKLFDAQITLCGEDNIVHIREKVVNMMESFRKCNAKAFEDWIQQDVTDWRYVGNVQQLLSSAGLGAVSQL